jgi:hypothetical protein
MSQTLIFGTGPEKFVPDEVFNRTIFWKFAFLHAAPFHFTDLLCYAFDL